MDVERNDALLMELLKEKKTIIGFLDSVFGFLARRTDFYHEMKSPEETIGFPSGVKEQLVLKALRAYDRKIKEQSLIPPAVKEEVVESHPITENAQADNMDTDKLPQCSQITQGFQPNEYYNGTCYESYCWSQTISDVEVHILVPNEIKSAKQLAIKINADSIQISTKNDGNVILQGRLSSKCKANDAVWSFSSRKLQITFDKVKEAWWDRLFDSEPRLDLSKMDCSRSLDELSDESQATIEKLRWDQQQKMLGLPTSEDVKNREMLRAAWNAEGSPFKGQPFDPSIVKFN